MRINSFLTGRFLSPHCTQYQNEFLSHNAVNISKERCVSITNRYAVKLPAVVRSRLDVEVVDKFGAFDNKFETSLGIFTHQTLNLTARFKSLFFALFGIG